MSNANESPTGRSEGENKALEHMARTSEALDPIVEQVMEAIVTMLASLTGLQRVVFLAKLRKALEGYDEILMDSLLSEHEGGGDGTAS